LYSWLFWSPYLWTLEVNHLPNSLKPHGCKEECEVYSLQFAQVLVLLDWADNSPVHLGHPWRILTKENWLGNSWEKESKMCISRASYFRSRTGVLVSDFLSKMSNFVTDY
jgi:hypothetical protein